MLEQSGPAGSPACPSSAGRQAASTYLATRPLSALLGSSGMEPEVGILHGSALRQLIFFSQFTQSPMQTFWVRSCLGRILLQYLPLSSPLLVSAPLPHSLPPCRCVLQGSAGGASQFLALLIWGRSTCPTTSLSLHTVPLPVPCGPRRSWWTLPQDRRHVPIPIEPPAAFSSRK